MVNSSPRNEGTEENYHGAYNRALYSPGRKDHSEDWEENFSDHLLEEREEKQFKMFKSKHGIIAPVFEDNKKVTHGQQMTRNYIFKKWWVIFKKMVGKKEMIMRKFKGLMAVTKFTQRQKEKNGYCGNRYNIIEYGFEKFSQIRWKLMNK